MKKWARVAIAIAAIQERMSNSIRGTLQFIDGFLKGSSVVSEWDRVEIFQDGEKIAVRCSFWIKSKKRNTMAAETMKRAKILANPGNAETSNHCNLKYRSCSTKQSDEPMHFMLDMPFY